MFRSALKTSKSLIFNVLFFEEKIFFAKYNLLTTQAKTI